MMYGDYIGGSYLFPYSLQAPVGMEQVLEGFAPLDCVGIEKLALGADCGPHHRKQRRATRHSVATPTLLLSS